jgi:hypothetical protein
MAEGVEVFPTIELIDRLYPPAGQECRFPIPIDITEDDLKLAASGKFVTRVIYVEDPQKAYPAAENLQTQAWFEASSGEDPLAVADGMGRPVAILRLGARQPIQGHESDPAFFFGSPCFAALPSNLSPAQPAVEAPTTNELPNVKSPEPMREMPAAEPSKTRTSDPSSKKSDTTLQPKVKNLAPPSRVLPVLSASDKGNRS